MYQRHFSFDENKTKGNDEYVFLSVPFLIVLNVININAIDVNISYMTSMTSMSRINVNAETPTYKNHQNVSIYKIILTYVYRHLSASAGIFAST